MRKNALLFIFLLTILLCGNGCNVAKKPQEPPQPPKKILVPQISTVSFDTVEIKNTPKEVQDVAKDIAGKDMATWLKVNNSAYILVSQSKKTSKYQVEIAEVLQKIPVENFIWIQVTLNYKPANGRENIFIDKPLVAKFDLPADRTISGVGFDLERARNIPEVKQEVKERPSPHGVRGNQTDKLKSVSLEISSPTANEEVTAPFKVTGKLKNLASDNTKQLIVRLRDNAGQIIVEKPVTNAQISSDNSFETTISYPAPKNPEKGKVEALLFNKETGAEKNIVKVPVTLK